jgi:hypothetical protein
MDHKMRRDVSLVLAALLFIASILLIAVALWERSFHEMAAAAVPLTISLVWWWEKV